MSRRPGVWTHGSATRVSSRIVQAPTKIAAATSATATTASSASKRAGAEARPEAARSAGREVTRAAAPAA